MKNNKAFQAFLVISAVILISFVVMSFLFRQADRDVRRINGVAKDAVNLPYYQKKAEQLRKYYDKLTGSSSLLTNGTEFTSQVPRAASRYGIRDISIENLGIQKETRHEITEIRVSALGDFRQNLSFLSEMENGAMPVQVKSLTMKIENGKVRSVIVLRLFRALPEAK